MTAVFAGNDRCAVGVLDTLLRRRRVPGQVPVSGYDDAAGLSHTNLTTVAQHPEQMTRRAVESVVERLEGEPGMPTANTRPPTATSASPAGTFSQSTRCQASPCTIVPPTTGLNPTEIPVIAPTPRPPCCGGTVYTPR